MSPRAACRLESLGFHTVFDYVLGISDWRAANLPIEGEDASDPTVADVLRPDVPTCDPSELIGPVSERVNAAGWEDCLVVECANKVVGRLRAEQLGGDPELPAVEVMQSGPSTVRPDQSLEELVKRMDRRPTSLAVVTTPEGSLLGAILLDEAHKFLDGEAPERIWGECDGCPGQWRRTSKTEVGRTG